MWVSMWACGMWHVGMWAGGSSTGWIYQHRVVKLPADIARTGLPPAAKHSSLRSHQVRSLVSAVAEVLTV